MADQQDLEKLLPKLNDIPISAVRYPDMPVEQAAKEGQVMATAAVEDSNAITAIGVEASLIAELEAAVAALRASQAKLTAAVGEVKEAGMQWIEEEPKAVELRSELLAALTYGLRKVPDANKSLKRIRDGQGSLDVIKDIQALAELGLKYPKFMQKMNYDLKQISAAAEKGSAISKLYAKAFIEKGSARAKDTRDRAFTYMRMLMGEVLDAAEYTFRKNPDRLEFYYSAYRSRQKGGAKAETTTDTVTPEAS